jgi:hypothetical protein
VGIKQQYEVKVCHHYSKNIDLGVHRECREGRAGRTYQLLVLHALQPLYGKAFSHTHKLCLVVAQQVAARQVANTDTTRLPAASHQDTHTQAHNWEMCEQASVQTDGLLGHTPRQREM